MRAGLGGAFFINTLESLAHEKEDKKKNLGVYMPSQKTHYHVRPFAVLGFKFVENATFSVLFDINLGFDFVYVSNEWKCIDVFNLGVQSLGITIERNISAYVRLFGRLSYERSNLLNALNRPTNTFIVLERESVLYSLVLASIALKYPDVHCLAVSWRGSISIMEKYTVVYSFSLEEMHKAGDYSIKI